MPIQTLLRPENLNSVEGLELLARQIVEGFMSGLNQSVKTGTGLEFSQYRSYQAGDDLRLLDWKMYGRSDRYYIRQAEVETNVNVRFVIDGSASMNHEDGRITKLQYARLLAATLGYLAIKQGDGIGLLGFGENKLYSLVEKQGRQHYHRFLYELIKIVGNGKWPTSKDSGLLIRKGQKEMIIFITDFFEENDEIELTLKSLKTQNNEVILLHILGKNEMDFNYKGYRRFEELESGRLIQSDIDQESYKKELELYLLKVRNKMMNLQINYELFSMDQGINRVLPLFLKRRLRLI